LATPLCCGTIPGLSSGCFGRFPFFRTSCPLISSVWKRLFRHPRPTPAGPPHLPGTADTYLFHPFLVSGRGLLPPFWLAQPFLGLSVCLGKPLLPWSYFTIWAHRPFPLPPHWWTSRPLPRGHRHRPASPKLQRKLCTQPPSGTITFPFPPLPLGGSCNSPVRESPFLESSLNWASIRILPPLVFHCVFSVPRFLFLRHQPPPSHFPEETMMFDCLAFFATTRVRRFSLPW